MGDLSLSRLVLGGHEYLPSGASRGFNEQFAQAVTPGVVLPGFGGPTRLAVLRQAYDLGINLFDVTIDTEKEALGRNLAQLPPPYPVHVQTRPEGMVYGYDPGNRAMVDLGRLRTEVQRCLVLLRREVIDILNLGIQQDALDGDPEFLPTLAHNIGVLRQDGLIRFAAADSFSGERTLLALVGSAAFDSLNLNFNRAEASAERAVIPAAHAAGMPVVAREVFAKGALFQIGRLGGVDSTTLAQAALRWAASRPGIAGVIAGAATTDQLRLAAAAIEAGSPDARAAALLDQLCATPAFSLHQAEKARAFWPD